jgi:hypothetical protein
MTEATTAQDSATSRGVSWAWMPVGLLASMLTGLGFMASLAVSDPNFAVEKDYYSKAVHWERKQAQARQNQALGYQLTLPGEVTLAQSGQLCFRAALSDAQGRPLTGAKLSVEAFANAFSGEVRTAVLEEASPGLFHGMLPTRRGGLWEFRFLVEQGTERFTSVIRRDTVQGHCP